MRVEAGIARGSWASFGLMAASILLALAPAARAVAQNTVLPIDLATALRLADERNLDIALYVERVAEVDARLSQARILAVPSLRVGTSYAQHDGALQDSSGGLVEADRTSRFTGFGAGAVGAGDIQTPGLGLAVDLADAIFQPLVARQNLAAVRAAATTNRHRVLLETAAAYLRLLQARSDTETVAGTLERARDLAALTADYAAAGEGLAADAEMAAVQTLLWEQRRLAAEERAAVAAAELAQLLHLEPDVSLAPVESEIPRLDFYAPNADIEPLAARALAARPEREQLDALFAAAETDFDAQRLGMLIPNISLGYSYGRFGTGAGSSIDDSAHRDDLGLQLYWQLDNLGLGNRARTAERRARLRQIALERDKLGDTIRAEIHANAARIASLGAQIDLADTTIARAGEAYALQRDRIFDRQGLPLEALQAMQTLASAELALNDAMASYSLAQLRLHTALGNPIDVGR